MFAGLEQVSAPAAPPRELAGIAAFAPDVFPPPHGRHHGTPTEKKEDEEEGGGGSLGPWTEDEEERGGG